MTKTKCRNKFEEFTKDYNEKVTPLFKHEYADINNDDNLYEDKFTQFLYQIFSIGFNMGKSAALEDIKGSLL